MLRRLARALLRASGWTLVGEIPAIDKAIFIVAPHTSNWDGFWLLAYKIALDVKLRFFAKHTLFWWPLGPTLRKLGAIPVERETGGAQVEKMTRLFAQNEHLYLALAPEGTRKWIPYWRTGFFQIAEAANVPIVMVFIDYGRRRLGIGPHIDPGGGVVETLARLREFYRGCVPKRPERMGPIAFPPRPAV